MSTDSGNLDHLRYCKVHFDEPRNSRKYTSSGVVVSSIAASPSHKVKGCRTLNKDVPSP